MEERGIYILTPPLETAFKALARKAAAEIGYTLTDEQVQALAYELAIEQPGKAVAVATVVAAYCGQLVYDLENEHPTHTWARWAADLENDQTPPCQSYTDYVDERHHLGHVLVEGQPYVADRGTRESLDAYFSKNSARLKSHVTNEQFLRFAQTRIAEGRMKAVGA
jgi:hypothetical protein